MSSIRSPPAHSHLNACLIDGDKELVLDRLLLRYLHVAEVLDGVDQSPDLRALLSGGVPDLAPDALKGSGGGGAEGGDGGKGLLGHHRETTGAQVTS